MKQLKILLLTSMLTTFSTCIHAAEVNMTPIISYILSDTVTATPHEIAIDKIKAYADDQVNPVPTIQDYIDAGVTGVTAENIDDVNSIVASLMGSEVDTTVEIQAVVDNVVVDTVSFVNDVMPILEANCKSCHTTTSKRIFKVGDAAYTHDNIITNNLINTTSPDLSSILLKGNGSSHNGGDQLSDVNSQILRDWIEEGGLNN